MISRAPRDWKRTSAGGIVLNERGRVAIVLQRDRSWRLGWTLPKGRLDEGETIEAAAVREVYEETGLRVRISAYVGMYQGKRRLTHYFRMRVEKDEGAFEDETFELRFVKPQKALRMMRSRRDRFVLLQALEALSERRAAPRRGARLVLRAA
jgi:8-oxo-dGTP pyrophosphatase MutT (NUDIX family)